MKSKKMPRQKLGGNRKREKIEAFGREILERLNGDREAINLVVEMIRVLGRRSRP